MAIKFLASLDAGRIRVYLVTDDATGAVVGVRTRNATANPVRVTLVDDGAAETVVDSGPDPDPRRSRRAPDDEIERPTSRAMRPVTHATFRTVVQPTR